jgi:uncharacterized membrane protein
MVVLPIVLVWFLLSELVTLFDGVVQPVVDLLPVDQIGGITVARYLAALLIVLLFFLAGLIMRTRLGVSIYDWLERTLLSSFPGYKVFKVLTHSLAGKRDTAGFKPALLRLDAEAHQPVLVVEEHDSGLVTVFIPFSPTPAAGTFQIVPAARVEFLDVSMTNFLEPFWHWGVGTQKLIERKG